MDSVYNANIERAVLASFLFNYDDFDDFCGYLNQEDFYIPAHGYIYKAMQDLHNEHMPLDEEFIMKKVDSTKVDDSFFIEVMTSNPISNPMAYAQEIKEGSRKRKLSTIATTIKKMTLEDEVNSSEAIDTIRAQLDLIESDSDIIEDYDGQQILEEKFESVPIYLTGIDCIDKEIDGVENGQLIYVTGLEETGKTHITYKIMENISYSRKVGIISLEFGKEKLQSRLKSMIKNEQSLTPSNIKASFNCHNIGRLEKTIKKWANDGCKFIVVDSINLIENPNIKDRFERVLNIGTRLFKLVQQLEITMFVISTSTKEDNKNGNPSIYGGQLLNNYCDQKWHIFRDFETEDRMLWINKNKQNYKYPKIDLLFLPNGEIVGKDLEVKNMPSNNEQPEMTEFVNDNSFLSEDNF